MGIYCIAAGSATENRLKTLDRSWSIAELKVYLGTHDVQRLRAHFPTEDGIFLWGANQKAQLARVQSEEYVIDFENQRVAHVFRFCFFTFTGSDTRLQRHVGWEQGRPYPFVYFLKSAERPRNRDKQFFLKAFNVSEKPHFFDGQKYLDDEICSSALRRTSSPSVEALLGLCPESQPPTPTPPIVVAEPDPGPPPVLEPPNALRAVIDGVQRLWNQERSLERDHEHAVAQFLEALGYLAGEDIRFQRSNMDIVLAKDGQVLAVIEVKADRALVSTHQTVINQAFGYALTVGAPFVVISNGNYYAVFDRRRGLSLKEQLCAEFRLLALDQAGLAAIETLRKGVLQ
jgi:hypothetical protein